MGYPEPILWSYSCQWSWRIEPALGVFDACEPVVFGAAEVDRFEHVSRVSIHLRLLHYSKYGSYFKICQRSEVLWGILF